MTWKPHTEHEMLCTKLGLRLGAPGSWVDDKRLRELARWFFGEGVCAGFRGDGFRDFEQAWQEWLDSE